jgi:hypothetical protein
MMAVLLIAVFPILLMINSQMAWLGISVGILLLYRDSRREARREARRQGPASVPPRGRKRPRARVQTRGTAIGLATRA